MNGYGCGRLPSQRYPLPAQGHVDVWVCDGAAFGEAEVDALAQTISAGNRLAADRLQGEVHRKRRIISSAMPMAVLGSYIDAPPDTIVLGYGRFGKPRVISPQAARGVFFNVSHSSDLTVVAVAMDGQLGVDIERVRVDIELGEVAPMCLTERELAALAGLSESDRVRAFFVCWTRKEALLKAQGMGLGRQPALVEAGLGAYEPMAQDSSVRTREGWTLSALDVGEDYVGALAIAGASSCINIQRWSPGSVGAFAISA